MNHHPSKQKKFLHRGFSLIETLVYIAVTVLVSYAGVTTFLSLNTVLIRNQTERTLGHSANVSLERMVRDIRSAVSVNVGGSTLGTSPGVLALSQGATTTTFSVSGGNVVVAVNGTNLGPLTSDAVTVQNLTFTRYVATTTEMVRVALTLSANSKAASTTRTFYTSAVLRGSYE